MRRASSVGLKGLESRATVLLATAPRAFESGIIGPTGVRYYPGNLKELRIRIAAIKNIKKITSSMKMIAASKLNRQQQNLFKTRPYAVSSQQFFNREWPEVTTDEEAEIPASESRLLVDVTSDRGLCGSVNSGIVRTSIGLYKKHPENTRFVLLGEKAKAALQKEYGKAISFVVSEIGGNKKASYLEISQIAELLSKQQFDKCTVLFNKFGTVLSSTITARTLPSPAAFQNDEKYDNYEFEDDREETLNDFWQFSVANLLYTSIVENQTAELGARMTSMDNASKNASEVLGKLSIKYNRQRQAAITTELTEIVSGAAAIEEQGGKK
jgi:ATP synthase F1 gamma subunit